MSTGAADNDALSLLKEFVNGNLLVILINFLFSLCSVVSINNALHGSLCSICFAKACVIFNLSLDVLVASFDGLITKLYFESLVGFDALNKIKIVLNLP